MKTQIFKKMLCIALCFSLVFSNVIAATATDISSNEQSGSLGSYSVIKRDSGEKPPANGVQYHALILSCETPENTLKYAPSNAAKMMYKMFEKSDQFKGTNNLKYTFIPNKLSENDAKNALAEELRNAYSQSDADDINYFYFCGHSATIDSGNDSVMVINNNLWITSGFLKKELDKYEGTFILMLDTCFSGALASKSTGYGEANFVNDFIGSFAEKTQRGAFEDGSNNADKYKLILSSSHYSSSLGIDATGITDTEVTDIISIPLLSLALTGGAGVAYFDKEYNAYPADCNNDKTITIAEMYRWCSKTNIPCYVRAYPENDSTSLLSYHDNANALGAEITDPQIELKNGRSFLTFDAGNFTKLEIGEFMIPFNNMVGYTVCTGSQIYGKNPFDFPENPNIVSVIPNSRNTIEISSQLPPSEGSYAILVRPHKKGSAAVSVALTVLSDGTIPVTNNKLSIIKPLTNSVFEPKKDSRELRISMQLKETPTVPVDKNPPKDFSALLSCQIKDIYGGTVRVLADNVQGRLNPIDNHAALQLADCVNEFFWDGKTDAGAFAESGKYKIVSTVNYGVNGGVQTKEVYINFIKPTDLFDPAPTTTFNIKYSGGPLANATVLIKRGDETVASAVTNAKGMASFNLSQGTYNYTITVTGLPVYGGNCKVGANTNRIDLDLYTSPEGGGPSGEGNSGSGGGSNSGWSTKAAPSPTEPSDNVAANGEVKAENVKNETKAAVTNAVKAALAAGKPSTDVTAEVMVKNAERITPAALNDMAQAAKAAGGKVILKADTIGADGSVTARLYLNPSLAKNLKGDIQLGVKTDWASTQATREKLKSFGGKMAIVSFAQQGKFGMRVDVAVKTDLTGLNTKALLFYSYDKATNKYTPVPVKKYWIDKNGYLHFDTETGGDLIITDKPLTTKK
ncbi:MAG: caspase family protein [Hydrogenoanaerobacterium sp.]